MIVFMVQTETVSRFDSGWEQGRGWDQGRGWGLEHSQGRGRSGFGGGSQGRVDANSDAKPWTLDN